MFRSNKHNKEIVYPEGVVTSLDDLMRFEYLVQGGNILPSHPVYSILAGRHASKLRGRGMDFEEVRKYVPGDDIRNIDWRVTARTGKTHSKVFNEEKERPTFTVLDQSSTMFFGSQLFVKSVAAAHAAALSAFYTVKRGDRFGGIVFDEDGYDFVSPRRSKALVQHYLQLIVERNAKLPTRKVIKNNSALLTDILKRTRSIITHDYVVTVISDFSRMTEETKRLLRDMSYHNDVIVIHIYDPMEEKLPEEKLILTDGRYQIAWKNSQHNWGSKYTNDFIRFKSALVEELRHYNIPVSFLSTASPIEDQVMKSFGRTLK